MADAQLEWDLAVCQQYRITLATFQTWSPAQQDAAREALAGGDDG